MMVPSILTIIAPITRLNPPPSAYSDTPPVPSSHSSSSRKLWNGSLG